MRYDTLASDYDGTLATHGLVDESIVAGLRLAKAGGLRLILVTGRELTSLFATFDHTDVFDRVVAENGAVLYNPATKGVRLLAAPPPADLVARLTLEQIPIEVGHSVIATVEPHEHALLTAIHELGLDWQVVFNKGSVMALPSGVNKATGLGPALDDVGAHLASTVGIGDAENDHSFMQACGFSVAVQNALPAVKASARLTTERSHGDGVLEVIDLMMNHWK